MHYAATRLTDSFPAKRDHARLAAPDPAHSPLSEVSVLWRELQAT